MDEIQNQNQEPQNQDSSLKTVGAFVWDLVKILIIALVIIVPFRMFIAEHVCGVRLLHVAEFP